MTHSDVEIYIALVIAALKAGRAGDGLKYEACRVASKRLEDRMSDELYHAANDEIDRRYLGGKL